MQQYNTYRVSNPQNVGNVVRSGNISNQSTSPGGQQSSPGMQESGTGLGFTPPMITPQHSTKGNLQSCYNLRSRCRSSCMHAHVSENQSISFAEELKVRKAPSKYHPHTHTHKADKELTDTATTRVRKSQKSQKRLFK
eukprot:TRINITY_DN9498_c3_g1_i1.p2 TRINITY_DN9498_c3_g1~~TRINITY_DN9498_c3_g1_i1.p2  ORF type:complete len:162 (+),score=2.36 TRINITY_DN9498_c3_g1_i1:74-487(+)